MRFIVLAFLLAAASASANVPPPPLSSQVASTAAGLAQALKANDASVYEQLLADNLEVWVDGTKTASSKAEWMSRFRPKLETQGVKYRIDRMLAGNQSFLLVTYYDSRGSFEVGHQECCQLFEAAQYELSAGKVSRIRILTTGQDDLTRQLK